MAPLFHPYPFILSTLSEIKSQLGNRLVARLVYDGLLVAYMVLLQLLVSRKPQIPASLLGCLKLPDKETAMAIPGAMMTFMVLLMLVLGQSGRKLIAFFRRFVAPARQLATFVASELRLRTRRARGDVDDSSAVRQHLLGELNDTEMQSAV